MAAEKITRTCVNCGTTKRTPPFYCSRHCAYEAVRRDMPRRFWLRVNKTATCWIWLGPFANNGYGKFWFGGKTMGAHRMAYQLFNGPIPEGLFVLHRCDVRRCVNPAHLFIGTQAENMRDKIAKGRDENARNWAKRLPERVCRGAKQWQSKITEENVRTIRTERAEGTSVIALAKRFNMTSTAIYFILNRHTWKHVK